MNTVRIMSGYGTIQRAVMVSDISQSAKLVYCLFVSYAGATGECFPSLSTIAKELSMGKTTVTTAIKELIDCNLLLKQNRYNLNGSSTSNLYFPLMLEGGAVPVRGTDTDTHRGTEAGTPPSCDGYGVVLDKATNNNTYKEPVINSSFTDVKEVPEKIKAVKKPVRKKAVKKSPPVSAAPPEYKQFIDLYHKWFIKENGIAPKIDALSGKSAKEIIIYLRYVVNERATRENRMLSEEDLQEGALASWSLVLDNWSLIDKWQQDKTKLNEISSQIQNILKQIKNGSPKKKQPGSGTITTNQTVVDTISQRFK